MHWETWTCTVACWWNRGTFGDTEVHRGVLEAQGSSWRYGGTQDKLEAQGYTWRHDSAERCLEAQGNTCRQMVQRGSWRHRSTLWRCRGTLGVTIVQRGIWRHRGTIAGKWCREVSGGTGLHLET